MITEEIPADWPQVGDLVVHLKGPYRGLTARVFERKSDGRLALQVETVQGTNSAFPEEGLLELVEPGPIGKLVARARHLEAGLRVIAQEKVPGVEFADEDAISAFALSTLEEAPAA